jgi:hypothetical protein
VDNSTLYFRYSSSRTLNIETIANKTQMNLNFFENSLTILPKKDDNHAQRLAKAWTATAKDMAAPPESHMPRLSLRARDPAPNGHR